MKHTKRVIVSLYAGIILLAGQSLQAGTKVYFHNNTPFRIALQTQQFDLGRAKNITLLKPKDHTIPGTKRVHKRVQFKIGSRKISIPLYAYTQSVAPGKAVRTVEFNRDKGVKKGKIYGFTTQVVIEQKSPISELSLNAPLAGIKLEQKMTGKANIVRGSESR